MKWVLLSAMVFGGSAFADAPVLAAVLERAGKQLAASNLNCSFDEKSIVEQLDSDKKVKAREVHTFRAQQSPAGMKRTFVGSKTELGELSSRLRPKKDDELTEDEKKRRREFRTPLHPQEQAKYRFRFAQPPANGVAQIAFEPIEKHVEKGFGVATVDLESGDLLKLTSTPSDFPMGLSELDSKLSFSQTACGLRLSRLEVTGEGGILMVRMRFHSITELTGHAAAK